MSLKRKLPQDVNDSKKSFKVKSEDGEQKPKQAWKTSNNSAERKPAVLDRHDRKVLRKERRAAKPHSALVAEANELYKFGLSRMEPEARRAKIDEILTSTLSNINDLLSKHDTSRVYQLMAKFGSAEQRATMHAACTNHYLTLATNHYAHHFVLKLMQYGTPVFRQQMVNEWRGRIEQLAFHADGQQCLDLAYAMEKSKAKQQRLIAELLHPTMKLLDDEQSAKSATSDKSATQIKEDNSMTIASICARQPAIKDSLITSVLSHIERFINKGSLQLRFVQNMILDLFQSNLLSTNQRGDLVASLSSSPALPAMCTGESGPQVLSFLLLAGGAKERKSVLKAIKGHVKELSLTQFGHLVVMRALALVDDTVNVSKSIWSELADEDVKPTDATADSATPFWSLMTDVHGAKILAAHFMAPEENSLLSPFEHKFLAENQVDGVSASKKDTVTRCQEHASYSLIPILTTINALDDESVNKIIDCNHGSLLLNAAFSTAEKFLNTSEDDIKASLLKPKLAAIRPALEETSARIAALLLAQSQAKLEERNFQMFVKRALSIKLADTDSNVTEFSRTLAESVVTGITQDWVDTAAASNRGCFILLATLQSVNEGSEQATKLISMIRASSAQAAIKAQPPMKGDASKSGTALLAALVDKLSPQASKQTEDVEMTVPGTAKKAARKAKPAAATPATARSTRRTAAQ